MAKRRRPSLGSAGGWPTRRPSNRAVVGAILTLIVAIASLVDHYRPHGNGGTHTTAREIEHKAGTVTHVLDGDTIDVVIKEGEPPVSVRLLGIDTPEPKGPSREFGLAASQYTRNRCEGKQVTLRTDELQREKDKYGRLLAYVYLNDELINESLVRDGMAFSHRTLRCDMSAQLDAAENEARNAKRGLWKTMTVTEMPEWRQKWMAEHNFH